MQAGKSPGRMASIRPFLPAGVEELHYPEDRPADDGPMREYLALELLRGRDGAWFFDHDAFLLEPAQEWLDAADQYFAAGGMCLCTAVPREGPGLTQPAYWLSPSRWPDGLSSFDPIPFEPKPYAKRPDLYRHSGSGMAIPGKDTLVQVAEELDGMGRASTFPTTAAAADDHPLPPFPRHEHIGGLHLYTGPADPKKCLGWMREVVPRFERFFSRCPPEWLAIEDPELLRRHEQFRGALR